MRSFLALILCCTLLSGCAAAPPLSEGPEASTIPETTSGHHAPSSAVEVETNCALRSFPLYISNTLTGFYPMGDHILVFSETEGHTLLTLFQGDTLSPGASFPLGFGLSPEEVTLQVNDSFLSFYDRANGNTLVLDSSLNVLQRIPNPENLMGEPVLSSDGKALYYCTSDSLRVLDLNSGISRCLKETHYIQQYISGLLLKDTVLRLEILDSGSTPRTLYLSTESGQLLYEDLDRVSLTASDTHYYAVVQNGPYSSRVFGMPGQQPQALIPEDSAPDIFYLPNCQAALRVEAENGSIHLDYLDLSSGCQTAQLTYSTEYYPWSIRSDSHGRVWFLNFDPSYGCDVLYCWEPDKTAESSIPCAEAYFTAEEPDYEGLARCALYAREIGEKYGVEVLTYHDATAAEPWDYDMIPEHQVSIIRKELTQLDQYLSHYPPSLLKTLAEEFGGLRICIVRSLLGSAETRSLDSAVGIQFFQEDASYIALAACSGTEYALYHELCHLIDTVILSQTSAYSRWEDLNPDDFSYDYDYIANQSRDGSVYLLDGSRSFVDTYSMSFPKEDRARIMEYAMTAGNRDLFQSPVMQQKLATLCDGIRTAFHLDAATPYIWEQYLIAK